MNNVKRFQKFVSKNKLLLIILAVLALIFYWYEVRPSQIRQSCDISATESAQSLLKTKAELSSAYKELVEKDLYLKDDYASIYSKCLSSKGLKK